MIRRTLLFAGLFLVGTGATYGIVAGVRLALAAAFGLLTSGAPGPAMFVGIFLLNLTAAILFVAADARRGTRPGPSR